MKCKLWSVKYEVLSKYCEVWNVPSRCLPRVECCFTKLWSHHRSFVVTAKLISAFVFATRIVQFLFYLNLKFQASSCFLCLYRPVCAGPVRRPHCWFSHEAAQIQCFVHTCIPVWGLSIDREATLLISEAFAPSFAAFAAPKALYSTVTPYVI